MLSRKDVMPVLEDLVRWGRGQIVLDVDNSLPVVRVKVAPNATDLFMQIVEVRVREKMPGWIVKAERSRYRD